MRARVLFAACLMSGLMICGSRADDPPAKKPEEPAKKPVEKAPPKPLDRNELDLHAAKVAFDASKLGSELWEEKKYEGTFRLYQGTLMALEPLLDHRPRLAVYIRVRLERAHDMKPEDGAFVLREALDAIRKEISDAQAAAPKKASLWERLGGEKVVKAVVHDFVADVMKDPKVNFSRNGEFKLSPKQVVLLEEHLVEIVSEIARGPLPYTGRDIPKAHAGMKITSAEYDAFVADFDVALKKHKVAESESDELLNLLRQAKPLFVDR